MGRVSFAKYEASNVSALQLQQRAHPYPLHRSFSSQSYDACNRSNSKSACHAPISPVHINIHASYPVNPRHTFSIQDQTPKIVTLKHCPHHRPIRNQSPAPSAVKRDLSLDTCTVYTTFDWMRYAQTLAFGFYYIQYAAVIIISVEIC